MAGFAVFTWHFVRASAVQKLELLEHEEDACLPSYASIGWLVGWVWVVVFGIIAVENTRLDRLESVLMAVVFACLIWVFIEINAAAWGLVFMSLGLGHAIGLNMAWARGSLPRYGLIWLATTVIFWGLLWLVVRLSNNSASALSGYLIWVGVHLGIGASLLLAWWGLHRYYSRQVRAAVPNLPDTQTLDEHLTDGDLDM